MVRNAAWFAARTIAWMDPNERAAFDAERSADGWRATIERRLRRWPTEYNGPCPTVDGVVAAMEEQAFPVPQTQPPRPYVTMPPLKARDAFGAAGYVGILHVYRKDGAEVTPSEHNGIEILLQDGIGAAS
jgi:hypothetical protein